MGNASFEVLIHSLHLFLDGLASKKGDSYHNVLETNSEW